MLPLSLASSGRFSVLFTVFTFVLLLSSLLASASAASEARQLQPLQQLKEFQQELQELRELQQRELPGHATFPPAMLLKRAGFVGMRGKKDDIGHDFSAPGATFMYDEGDDHDDDKGEESINGVGVGVGAHHMAAEKRGGSGFVGMRGKKDVVPLGRDDLRWLSQLAKSLDMKRAGFVGMRGKKSGEQVDDFPIMDVEQQEQQEQQTAQAKRAGFVGMRGKKELRPQPQRQRQRQRQQPVWTTAAAPARNLKMRRAAGGSAGFVGMRG